MPFYLRIIFAGCFVLNGCNSEPERKQSGPLPSPQLDAVSKQISEDPSDGDLYFTRGRLLLDLGRFDEGIADLEKAAELAPSPVHFQGLSEALFYLQRIPASVDALEECVQHFPGNVDCLLRLAKLNLYLREHQKSIANINDALRADVTNPEAYFLKGMNLKETGDTAGAISSFQTATEQDPRYYDAFMQLGLLLGARRDSLAVDYLNNAIRIDSQSTEARYAAAMFWQENGRPGRAKRIYREIILIDPQNENAFYNLGYLFFFGDSLELAFKHFDFAVKVSPAYAKAWFMRGRCLEAMGNNEGALKDYHHSLNLQPDFELASKAIGRLKE